MKLFSFENFFKTIDYFGLQVQITFDKQKKFKTYFGGFLSLMIYCLIFALIITNGLNLLNKKNAKTTATNLHQINAPLLNISELNSIYISYFYTKEFIPFLDPTYFDIKISQFLLKVDANGNTNLSYIPLEKVNCSLYYNYFHKNNFGKDFSQNNMLQGICFDNQKYKELVIGGKFGTEYYSNILYSLRKCKNNTIRENLNNNYNITQDTKDGDSKNKTINNRNDIICKSSEEIDAKIQSGYFEFFYFDKNINLNDYDYPINEYLNVYFILLDPKTKKFVDLYFKTVNLFSDSGLIFEETKISQFIMFDNFREQIELGIDSDVVIDFYVNSSNNVIIYTRSYVKFQEFAANIGGLMQILIIFGSILTSFYKEHRMNEMMINSLFIVKDEYENDKFINFNNKKISLNKNNKKIGKISKFKKNHSLNNKENVYQDLNKLQDPNIYQLKNNNSIIKSKLNNTINLSKYNDDRLYLESKNENSYNNVLKLKNEKEHSNNFKNFYNNKKSETKYFAMKSKNKDNFNSFSSQKIANLDYSSNNELINLSKNSNLISIRDNINLSYNLGNTKKEDLSISKIKINDNPNINKISYNHDYIEEIKSPNKIKIESRENRLNSLNSYSNCYNENKNIEEDAKNINTEINQRSKVKEFNEKIEVVDVNQIHSIEHNSKKVNLIKSETPNRNASNIFVIDDKIRSNFYEKLSIYKKDSEYYYKLKWYEVISIKLCTCTNLCKKKKKIYNLSSLKLFKYLDFLNILKYLQEFNKMKKIYFSRKQLDLFSISSKPIISLEKLNKYQRYKNILENQINKDKYLDMLYTYKRFLQKSENNEKLKKLTENMDPQIKNIFDEVLGVN